MATSGNLGPEAVAEAGLSQQGDNTRVSSRLCRIRQPHAVG